MRKHLLKSLFLLAAVAVAPANAGHLLGGAAPHSPDDASCPHERARLEVQSRAEAQRAAKAPTRVTLTEGLPSERPLRNVAPGAYFTP